MCYTYGCRRPYAGSPTGGITMGDERNIVEEFFERAGETDAIAHAGAAEAKRHMLELLQAELELNELAKPREQY